MRCSGVSRNRWLASMNGIRLVATALLSRTDWVESVSSLSVFNSEPTEHACGALASCLGRVPLCIGVHAVQAASLRVAATSHDVLTTIRQPFAIDSGRSNADQLPAQQPQLNHSGFGTATRAGTAAPHRNASPGTDAGQPFPLIAARYSTSAAVLSSTDRAEIGCSAWQAPPSGVSAVAALSHGRDERTEAPSGYQSQAGVTQTGKRATRPSTRVGQHCSAAACAAANLTTSSAAHAGELAAGPAKAPAASTQAILSGLCKECPDPEEPTCWLALLRQAHEHEGAMQATVVMNTSVEVQPRLLCCFSDSLARCCFIRASDGSAISAREAGVKDRTRLRLQGPDGATGHSLGSSDKAFQDAGVKPVVNFVSLASDLDELQAHALRCANVEQLCDVPLMRGHARDARSA